MLEAVEKLSNTTRRLTINVPSDVIQSETDSLYNEIRTTTKIPGFRPGKVPQGILVKKFGKKVEAQVIETIVPRYYLEAVKEAKIEPVNYPDISEKIELTAGQPLSFTVTVEVKPEVDNINYEGIVLEKKEVSVGDEEVDKAISSLQESKALYTVSEDALKKDDMAVITYEAFDNETKVEELCHADYPLIIGTEGLPEEFSSALTGKKKGDQAEVTIPFEGDNPNKTLAGKNILFKISVGETKTKSLPPLDDEFARSLESKSLEELKTQLRDGIVRRKEGQINLDHKKVILNTLIERHGIEAPPSMVQGEIESMIQQEKENAMRTGKEAKPDDELKKEYAEKARDNVKGVLILDAIGKQENIEVNDDDVKKAIEEIAERNNLKPEEVTRLYAVREGSMDALKSRLFADKVLDFVLEKSTVQ